MAGLVLLPVLSHAGGLGLAPLVAILGGVGLLTYHRYNMFDVPSWVWMLLVFLVWAALTSLWSPYEDTQTLTNPVKLLIGAFLYLGAMLTFKTATVHDRSLLRHMFVAAAVLSIGLLLIDIFSGYALTFLVDPLQAGEDSLRKRGDTEMNLGHAITVLALMLAPVMMMIRRQFNLGLILSLIFALFVACTAIFGQLMIGVLSVMGTVIFMVAARLKPLTTLRFLVWVAILSILMAPFVGYALGFVPDTVKASMPFSWEHRLEMWTYTADKILAAPLWGHGFDAVRTFDDTFSSRGINDWPIVSLHPHNAGLHIWVETGLIGAALCVITIMLMGLAAEEFIYKSPLRAIATCGFLAAVIIISNVTYGIWQDWWWAIVICIAASLHLLPARTKLA